MASAFHAGGEVAPTPDQGRGHVAAREARAAHVVDVFAYVVVLNLAVEYLPSVITETFSMSILTAVLLKLVLEVVVAAKNRLKARLRAASTPLGKVVSGVLLWLLLVASKFVVLELIAFVFDDLVSLGGFVSVTALILALMAARAGVRRLLDSSTPRTSETASSVG